MKNNLNINETETDKILKLLCREIAKALADALDFPVSKIFSDSGENYKNN